MNAVNVKYVGAASGVNNAVSRIASLLAIALLGIVMLKRFSHSLTQRMAPLQLSPQAQQFLERQRVNLAAAAVPPGLPPKVEAALRSAIVDGFRLVMGIAVGFAIASAITAALMIERRSKISP